jgi:hypothetical protein
MTDEQHASILYGTPYGSTPPAKPTAPANPAPTTDAELVDRLFTGPEPQRDYTTGELLPVETPVTRSIVSAGIERFGMDPAEAQASAQQWQSTLNEFDVYGAEAEHLVSLGVAALAGVEVDELALRNAARTALQVEYGQAADTVLDDARRLVARTPALHDFLANTQLGSNPQVVLVIARRARALRAAGKL